MTIRHRITTALVLLAAWLQTSPLAFAQEYVKVEDAARENLPAPQFVGAAYGFIWVALMGYVFIVARGLGRARTEIEELRRRVERATGGTDAR